MYFSAIESSSIWTNVVKTRRATATVRARGGRARRSAACSAASSGSCASPSAAPWPTPAGAPAPRGPGELWLVSGHVTTILTSDWSTAPRPWRPAPPPATRATPRWAPSATRWWPAQPTTSRWGSSIVMTSILSTMINIQKRCLLSPSPCCKSLQCAFNKEKALKV